MARMGCLSYSALRTRRAISCCSVCTIHLPPGYRSMSAPMQHHTVRPPCRPQCCLTCRPSAVHILAFFQAPR
eukprot:359992-Chlamydomonas_euryale.AAC.4